MEKSSKFKKYIYIYIYLYLALCEKTVCSNLFVNFFKLKSSVVIVPVQQ